MTVGTMYEEDAQSADAASNPAAAPNGAAARSRNGRPHPPGPAASDPRSDRLAAIDRGESLPAEVHPELASEEHVLRIQNLKLWYGAKQALFDVSLDVPKGQVTA
ncbi:MAG: hypothetical protein AAF907_01720, partial [Planctomycetota bacterium]